MTKFLLFCSHHRWLKGTAKPLNNKAFPPCCNARTVRSVDETRKVFGMAGRKGWTIMGVDERGGAEGVAAAGRAGMPLHAWVEQAVREALQPEPQPACCPVSKSRVS